MNMTRENRRIKIHSNRQNLICNLKKDFLFCFLSFFGCIWIKVKSKTLEWEKNSDLEYFLFSIVVLCHLSKR